MSRRTSFDELYSAFGSLIFKATGRDWWIKSAIQARPRKPYATITFTEMSDFQQQVIEEIEITPYEGGKVFTQTPWGSGILDCEVEFLKSAVHDRAMDAATRLKNALQLEERFWDVWEICGLIGNVRVLNVSGIFRADSEPRAQVRFQLQANITDPLPLQDAEIYDVQSQTVNTVHTQQNNVETHIQTTIDKEEA